MSREARGRSSCFPRQNQEAREPPPCFLKYLMNEVNYVYVCVSNSTYSGIKHCV